MTVEQMRRQMPAREYVAWGAYHARKAQRQEMEQKMASARRGKGGGRTR